MRCPKCFQINSFEESLCDRCGENLFPSRSICEDLKNENCSIEFVDEDSAVKSALKDWNPKEADLTMEDWDHELASRFTRLLAQGIDFSLLFLFFWGVGAVADSKFHNHSDIVFYAMCGWILFNFIMLLKDGQTVGKKLLRIQIAELYSDTVPSFLRIVFARGTIQFFNITSVLGIINLLFIFRKDRRCIHDHIAGTWVVKVNNKIDTD